MKKVQILTDTPRRRRFTDDMKLQILAKASEPGAVVADVARRYEISQSLIYLWRRQAKAFEKTSAAASPLSDFSCFVREKPEPSALFSRGLRVRLPTGILIEWSEPVSLANVVALTKQLGGLA